MISTISTIAINSSPVSTYRRKPGRKTGTAGRIFRNYNLKQPEDKSCMDQRPTSETTQLLRAWAAGDTGALERLTPRVYTELRRIAGHFMRAERPGRTEKATALVHEAYLRLIEIHNVDWEHRAHFFAVSAQIFRRILLDCARRRVAAKRGGPMSRVSLDGVLDPGTSRARELVALDDELKVLAELDPRKARIIELRFFGGLTAAETAEVLKVSSDTVLRDWRIARTWLLAQLEKGSGPRR